MFALALAMRLNFFLFLIPVLAVSFVLRPSSTTLHRRITNLSSTYDYEPPFQPPPFQPSTTMPSTDSQSGNNIRPLHQNWWPAVLEDNLDEDKPNAIEILATKLVLFKSEGDWTCLDDRCSHRFAPLSEGRVIVTKESTKRRCVQCSYHGWEFNSYGRCQYVPQTGQATGAKAVPAYPVKLVAGIVWVFMDPNSPNIAGSLKLPVNSLLERWHHVYGDMACFTRDLPFGYELLGENLMDLAQIIYSHPSLGDVNRGDGSNMPIPLTMLSASQRSQDQPLFEAEVQDAKNTDPFFRTMEDYVPNDAMTRIAFYEASHVRYTRRAGGALNNVEFFLCPLAPGKSRVFMYSLSELALQQKEAELRTGTISPTGLKNQVPPDSYEAHLNCNKLFDGDGVFLALQGDRMQRAGLTFRDYATPASADILVNAFRRYLEAASDKTADKSQAEAANPSDQAYDATVPRSAAMDRYYSHTKNCRVCSQKLEKLRSRKKVLSMIQNGLTGAAGASTISLLVLFILGSEVAIPLGLLRCVVATTVASDLGVVGILSSQRMAEKKIEEFLTEGTGEQDLGTAYSDRLQP